MFNKKQKDSGQSESVEQSWYKDKYESVRSQRDLLALITVVSLLSTAAASAAIMYLTPYKSVEPYLIKIDQTSGIVKRVDPVTRDEYTANEAVDRYFIAQYVSAREGYLPSIVQEDYNLVRVMSSQDVFSDYVKEVSQANPDSAVNTLGTIGRRNVKFKSINYINLPKGDYRQEKVAQARVTLTNIPGRSQPNTVDNVIATITFEYRNLTLSERERFLNPLGFFVTAYDLRQETL